MRRRAWMGVGAAVLAAGLGLAWRWGQAPATAPAPAVQRPATETEVERLRAHVRMLSETFHPRDSRHPENLERAADYIAGHLARAGGHVESQHFRVDGRDYRNVIARFGPEDGERIVVGAHYDSVRGTPGADDNASGVAGLLDLAARLGRQPPPLRVDLVAYTLEEPPHFRTGNMGSAVHARALKEAGGRVRAMVALEMLGHFTDVPGSQEYPLAALKLKYPDTGHFIGVVGTPGDGGLTDTVAEAMRGASPLPVESLSAPRALEGVDFSDHGSFWAQGYRAVMVTDTAFFRNPRYHEAGDTWDTLDYARMAQAVQGVYAAVRTLAGSPSPSQ
ncbi:M28 family peptidase [Myxococcus llanfairpwllgwyngyllgogerychwyrndrobwllllantysiliogogogochensis]|uniref:M28 family peptidase n=1 Tax=Myxococcus llanfairpwllgwyngyllgogerychwyrndrobwllllantysiliogogogochensis TaxID=2590453 RepID=A0A540WRF5_9BACT|nr:M28 family peptidase [Myxococcus llanfairpwllgwyngyllgogerychwyrndrobwllllantysiliogogogochensis]TQF11573.1 M28 family peptidase [Myxococcus llanfairpwllgwyngyllgogerychwyrndrobwllllantysiliogogogochensis]